MNEKNSNRVEMIRNQLDTTFSPQSLDIIDDSHKHAGHAAAQGGGHFSVKIIADDFDGKSLIQRHRMIYTALEQMMKTDIHALSINALSPNEGRN